MATRRTILQYLTTTRIGEKGQVTVPKRFRQNLGLGTGAPFAVLRLGDGLLLIPEQNRFARLCDEMSAALTAAGATREAVLATLPDARKSGFERRYRRIPADTETSVQSAKRSGAKLEACKAPLVPGFKRTPRRHRRRMGSG
jgi:AbrB family looped-hinge helix DNA binding protein